MAEAGLMDAEPIVLTPPPASPEPKGKPGPKPGYKPFNNELTPEDFFVLLNDIDDADWPKSLCYAWRRDPFTDNTNGGREPKYIDVINRAVTERDVKEEHGSGTYKLQLNTNDKYVAHTILTIEDPKFPPHVPPGDWFNNPRNKKWATWKPLVEKWWKDKLALLAGPATPAPASDSPALGELTRLISQLANNNGKGSDSDKPLVAWALQQIADEKKAGREADSPGKLAELVKVIKELSPPPAPAQDNQMLTFLLAQLTRVQESNDKLIHLMLTQKTAESKQPDPLAQVETMAKLITTVSGIVQPAQAKEWYQDLAETVAPKLVDLGTQLVAMQNRAPAAPRALPPPAPPPTQAGYQNPPPPAPPQVTATAPEPQPTGEPEMDTMQRTILITVANMAAQALNLGVTGDEFAEKLCYKFGGAVYDNFLDQVPQDKLLPLFHSLPECWAVLQPFEGGLPHFIESFYAFAQEPDDEDTISISQRLDEITPAAPPVKVKKGKAK